MTEDITEALQREIPTLYLDRADDAYYVAEAIAYSDWLAAHDAEVAARTRKETLREAAEVAKAWGRANEEGGYARSAFTVARKIRALAEKGAQ